MLKNRMGFILLMALFAILLIYSGNIFFLAGIIVLAVCIILLAILINVDAKKIRVAIEARDGGRENDILPAYVIISNASRLLVAQSVYIEVELENIMIGTTTTKSFLLMLTDKDTRYDVSSKLSACGEIHLHIKKAKVYDMFHIWHKSLPQTEDACTTIYPRSMDIQISASGKTTGTNNDEGISQNKKGNDHSEMYDLREYVPGDDVRSIHWKLSSKADDLVLRESSNPSHYSIVIMPDYGRQILDNDIEAGKKYINTILAAGASLGSELLKNGIFFCMALPTAHGLELFEVTNRNEWMQVISQWMSFPVQQVSGEGIQFFKMEHMARFFTRLVVLSAGRYSQNLKGMENELEVILIESSDNKEFEYTQLSGGIDMVSIPVDGDKAEEYRIFC